MSGKMILGNPPPIIVTGDDFRRLHALARSSYRKWDPQILDLLRAELERATIIEEPEAVHPFVKIGSHVVFRDEAGNLHGGTLTLPGQEWDIPRSISILSPVGAALLGLSVGQSISYQTSNGSTRRVTVLKV